MRDYSLILDYAHVRKVCADAVGRGTLKRDVMKVHSVVLRAFFAIALLAPPAWAAGPQIEVYKTRTCGCCAKWVDHLRANGFTATVTDVPSTAEYRKKY